MAKGSNLVLEAERGGCSVYGNLEEWGRDRRNILGNSNSTGGEAQYT